MQRKKRAADFEAESVRIQENFAKVYARVYILEDIDENSGDIKKGVKLNNPMSVL